MPITTTIFPLDTSDLLGFAPTISVEQSNGAMKVFPPTAAFSSGAATNSWSCLSISIAPGPVPSRAILREDYIDAIGPVTLNRYTANREYGRRVIIYDPATTEENANGTNDRVIFLGNIMGRHDSGQHDQKLWIAHDDREVLSNLFVRGAMVAEPDGTVIMNRRFNAHFNPSGLWNCTKGNITNLKNITRGTYNPKFAPVFAPYASLGRAYESPIEGTEIDTLAPGKVIPWTAKLALMYLCNLANMPKMMAIDGIIPNEWRSLSDSKRLYWNEESIIGLNAIDPANPTLPSFMDRKLPDLSIRGESFCSAIQKILNAVGCYAWFVGPTTFTDSNSGNPVTSFSEVKFFPIGTNATKENYTDITGVPLYLQRGGDLLHADSIYDFDVQEDASNVKPNVLVEGAPVRVETALYYNPENLALSDILPAWTKAEEDNFKRVILGTDLDEEEFRTYAKVPPIVGDVKTPFAQWEPADGKARGDGTYKPFAWASSAEAVSLARQYYPTVFIAFRINHDGLYVQQALDGVNGVFADRTKYPQMRYNRPILKEQLGYMLLDLLGDEKPANFMLNKFPVRICIKGEEDADYIDAVPTPNITITGDGTFWIRGISEELDGAEVKATSWRCLYDGSLFGNYVTKTKCKKLRINLAMPMDHRVKAYVNDASVDKSLVNSYCKELGGDGKGPILYIDNPDDSFNENHQWRSTPTATKSMSVGATKIAMPLTRIAPPGSEQQFAQIHANRRLMFTRKVEKKTSWKLPWIRLEFPLGTWISEIFCSDAYGTQSGAIPDYHYIVNAPIMAVTYDFQAQETNLAGLDGSL